MKSLKWVPTLILLVCLVGGGSCRNAQTTVTIFHAGSLSPLIGELAKRYESNHPGVLIQSEASGSLDAIRKITELGRRCDLVATADADILQRFLVPRYTTELYRFLGNEIVLAAGRNLQGENLETWAVTWPQRLFSGQYRYGISDPDRDPAGYYAHLVTKLAEVHYERPGLYRSFLLKLDPRWLRPKSAELTALLQTGALDFAYLYKSAAVQNGLDFISLPPQVSLGEEAYADLYSSVFVRIAGSTPDSEIEIAGRPIRYGIAIIGEATPSARGFLSFLLSAESQAVYREMGYQVIPVQQIVTD